MSLRPRRSGQITLLFVAIVAPHGLRCFDKGVAIMEGPKPASTISAVMDQDVFRGIESVCFDAVFTRGHLPERLEPEEPRVCRIETYSPGSSDAHQFLFLQVIAEKPRRQEMARRPQALELRIDESNKTRAPRKIERQLVARKRDERIFSHKFKELTSD